MIPTPAVNRRWLYRAPLAVFVLLCLYRSWSHPLHDFGNYYFGSYFFLKGEFSQDLYDPVVFNGKIAADGFRHIWLSYAPNPPFTALLFVPFALLPPPVAKLLFNLVTMVLFAWSYYRLTKHRALDARLAAFVPLVFVIPLYNGIQFGQVYLLMFFLLVEGYLALEAGRVYKVGILWALAVMLKIFPGVLFLYLLLCKEYKALLALTCTCMVLLGATLLFQGVDVWLFFLKNVLPKAVKGEATAAAYTASYQSFAMLLKLMFIGDSLDNPLPLLNSPLLFSVLMVLIKAVILACLVLATRVSGADRYKTWALWITSSVLLSAYGSTYSCVLLIVPLLAIDGARRPFLLSAAVMFVLINIPLKALSFLPVALQFPRLLAVVMVFIVILVSIRPAVSWKILALCVCLLALPEVLMFHKKDNGDYMLRAGQEAMIIDFRLDHGVLAYRYWSPDGPKDMITDFRAEPLAGESADLERGQIFLNKRQITFGPDTKRQPLATSKGVVYLTDEGRGYGFYAFKIIKPVAQ